MTLLRLDDELAGKPGMADLQPDMGQLSIPVHGAGGDLVSETPLTSALDFSREKAERIKTVVTLRQPIFSNVFTPLAKPFSTELFFGTDTLPWGERSVNAASLTVPVSAASEPTLSIEDYGVPGDGDFSSLVNSFEEKND